MKKLLVFSVVALVLVAAIAPLFLVNKANADTITVYSWTTTTRYGGYGYYHHSRHYQQQFTVPQPTPIIPVIPYNPNNYQSTLPLSGITYNSSYSPGWYQVLNGCNVNNGSTNGYWNNPCTNIPVMSNPDPNSQASEIYNSASGQYQTLYLQNGMTIYVEGSTLGTNNDTWLQINPADSFGSNVQVQGSLWVDSRYVQPLSSNVGYNGGCQIDSSKSIQINYSNDTVSAYQCGGQLAMSLNFSSSYYPYQGNRPISDGTYTVYEKSNVVMVQSQSGIQYELFAPMWNNNTSYNPLGIIQLSASDANQLYNWIPNPQSFQTPVYVIN